MNHSLLLIPILQDDSKCFPVNYIINFALTQRAHDNSRLLGFDTPCNLSGRYERFGGNRCIHLQGRRVAGGLIRINVAVRTRRTSVCSHSCPT